MAPFPRLGEGGGYTHPTHIQTPARGHCWTFRGHSGQCGGQGEEAMGMGGGGREEKQVATGARPHPHSWALCPAAYVLAVSARQEEKQVLACRAPTQ